MSNSIIAPANSAVRDLFKFEVEKYPLSFDGEPTPHYGLRRDDMEGRDAWVSLACKAGYEPHTTDDVVALAEAAIVGMDIDPNEMEIKGTFDNGHFLSIRPTMDHRVSIFGTDDNIFPQISIRAKYGHAFVGELGMYRDTCQNMTMIRQVRGTSIRLRHTGQFRNRFEETVESFRNLQCNFDQVVSAAQRFESVRVAADEFLARMFPAPTEEESQRVVTNHRNRIRAIVERVCSERHATGRPDANNLREASLWELVNGVTGYVQHTKTRQHKDATLRAFQAVDDKMCHEAWDLAYEMAS